MYVCKPTYLSRICKYLQNAYDKIIEILRLILRQNYIVLYYFYIHYIQFLHIICNNNIIEHRNIFMIKIYSYRTFQ